MVDHTSSLWINEQARHCRFEPTMERAAKVATSAMPNLILQSEVVIMNL